jgi:hypothetical protein
MIWRPAAFIISAFCAAPSFAQESTPAATPSPVVSPEPTVTPSAAENAEPMGSTPSPQPEVKPAPLSTNVTVKNKNFSKPLYFDFSNDDALLLPLEFEWDLTGNKGSVLKMGPVTLDENNFNFILGPVKKLLPSAEGIDPEATVFLMRWPDFLLKSGVLEMISRNGSVIWKYDVTADDIQDWKNKSAKWKRKNNFQLAIINPISKGAPFDKADEGFRFCISQGSNMEMTRLCSDQYISRKNKEGIYLARQVLKVPLRVIFQNEDAPAKKLVVVNRADPVQFYADLTSGISYEFVTYPPKAQITDISQTKNPEIYRVIGWDIFPYGKSNIIKKEQYGKITELIGFQATIKDDRKFWEAGIRTTNQEMYFPGLGGGVFRQKFNLDFVPKPIERVYLSKDTPAATYWNSVPLKLRKHPQVIVDSKEYSVKVPGGVTSTEFIWNFKADDKGEINKSYLTTNYQGKVHRSYFEVYRSSPHELSGRLTGLTSGSSLAFMGEVDYNYWLESIFGWDNYWLSYQRWGITARYFKSINQIPTNVSGGSGSVDVSLLDLKYRLSPGVWTRDEAVGAIMSYQDFKFDIFKTGMIGYGAFWARSMPQVFDKLFNYLPYMNYPKWVDMELIYYVAPTKSSVKLDSSLSLNFHGQVLWTKTFFGEAGFGLKRYSFTDTELEIEGRKGVKTTLNMFYGTAGLGLKF